MKRVLSIDFSSLSMDTLFNSLVSTANSLLDAGEGDESHLYTSLQIHGYKLFLYYSLRDADRLKSNLPMLLEYRMQLRKRAWDLKKSDKRVKESSDINYDVFVYNGLLGYKDNLYGEMNIRFLSDEVNSFIKSLLGLRNVYMMWHGTDYFRDLQLRITNIRRGIYDKDPVDFSELPRVDSKEAIAEGLTPQFIYNYSKGSSVNELLYNIHKANRYSISPLLISSLKRAYLLPDYLLPPTNSNMLSKQSHRSDNFAYAYPFNLFALFLDKLANVEYGNGIYCVALLLKYTDELDYLLKKSLSKLGRDNEYFAKLLSLRYKKYLSPSEIGIQYNVSGSQISADIVKAETALYKIFVDYCPNDFCLNLLGQLESYGLKLRTSSLLTRKNQLLGSSPNYKHKPRNFFEIADVEDPFKYFD